MKRLAASCAIYDKIKILYAKDLLLNKEEMEKIKERFSKTSTKVIFE